MAPTDDSKWAMLRELAFARFPEDVEVADAMHRVEELDRRPAARRRCGLHGGDGGGHAGRGGEEGR
jgi:hypothetical protein